MSDANALDGTCLDRLFKVIESRRGADPETSHTAKLLQRGTKRIAQKVGEEAVEAVIEAIRGNRQKLAAESADLVYHVLVMWADAGIKPADIDDIADRAEQILNDRPEREISGRELGALVMSELKKLDQVAAMAIKDPSAGGNPIAFSENQYKSLARKCVTGDL